MSDLAVVEPDDLDAIASRVRAEYRRSREALGESIDAYFAVGHELQAARKMLATDQAFGAWFRAQEFDFSQRWGLVLRAAAEHEDEVRGEVGSQLRTGRTPNIEKAVKQVVAAIGGTRGKRPPLAALPPARDEQPEAEPTVFSTIVADPPWRYDNVATRGAAEDHYPTMSIEELVGLAVPADDNAHLYLWVTNGFIREGFELVEAWGFTYKTILTWCKPQIGMGNYFRNSTEHVLFGVRGQLATLRNDVPTWFTANRTKHSAKPESFYDLVERSSPGPFLEMFARRRRMGWHTWGNEA